MRFLVLLIPFIFISCGQDTTFDYYDLPFKKPKPIVFIKGDKGDTGLKGDKGDKGDKGADGSNCTINKEANTITCGDETLQLPEPTTNTITIQDAVTGQPIDVKTIPTGSITWKDAKNIILGEVYRDSEIKIPYTYDNTKITAVTRVSAKKGFIYSLQALYFTKENCEGIAFNTNYSNNIFQKKDKTLYVIPSTPDYKAKRVKGTVLIKSVGYSYITVNQFNETNWIYMCDNKIKALENPFPLIELKLPNNIVNATAPWTVEQ